ncbi:CheA signal transduction histidine kinase [Geothermobacter ehrlichii]|uniref:Chemotaxis protein CheA n=2 Tax=Geothermobacter ehrlichii TaxID=213224 RepID=A0A5D3WKY7_9BACT|nr:CheA signal transduction histidine kinase [Geothermobacter ehrlichii]
MDMAKYRELFLSETREHLDSMSRLLVELEKQPDDADVLAALFRQAHSVKGMAASMGYGEMAEQAHALEDLLDDCRRAGRISPEAIDRLLRGCDRLEEQLEALAAEGKPAPDPADSAVDVGIEELPANALIVEDVDEDGPKSSPAETILLIDIAEHAVAPAARALLALRELERVGEVLQVRPDRETLLQGAPVRTLRVVLRSSAAAERIDAALLAMADIAGVRREDETEQEGTELPRRRREDSERSVRVRTELLDQLINLTGELLTTRTRLQTAHRERAVADLEAGLDQLSLLVDDLHYRVLQVRMMPLASITGRLPRMVRDLARKTGKRVELRIAGEEVELDRSILEELADPLIHMLRNAVDHGIEEEGVVAVRAWREKDLVLIEVSDNGRGIDPEVVRARAVQLGLVDAERLRAMGERDLFALLCRPGFSTAAQVTETSGRGVGMDVVKAAVEHLGGDMEILSAPGEGTRILLRLPLSVAIIKILLVAVGDCQVAIPITRVHRTLEVARDELQSSGRQLVLRLDEEVLPLLSLRKMLRMPGRPVAGNVPLVVVEMRGQRVGLVVDQLIGQHEVFVKSLEFPLDRLPGLTGASVLGDGRVVFIIDPQGLLEAGRPAAEHAA